MQVMIPAVFDRKAFDAILRNMTDDDAAVFAAANIGMFPGCFSIGGAAPRAESSAPVAPPEPKAPVAPPYEQETVERAVLSFVGDNPDERAETIAARLAMDGRAVKRALVKFVKNDVMYVDGTRRGARYRLATRKAETAE